MSQPDLSEFERLSRPENPPCRLGTAINALDPSDAEKLRAATAADRNLITASAIRQWLGDRGFEVSINMVSAHRRGVCACHRQN